MLTFSSRMSKHIRTNFNISLWRQRKIHEWCWRFCKKGKANGTTLSSVSDTLIDLTLIPIYTFLANFYRTHFITFFGKTFLGIPFQITRDLGSNKIISTSYISELLCRNDTCFCFTGAGAVGIKYFIFTRCSHRYILGNLIPYVRFWCPLG
jgi:hypothetical protein